MFCNLKQASSVLVPPLLNIALLFVWIEETAAQARVLKKERDFVVGLLHCRLSSANADAALTKKSDSARLCRTAQGTNMDIRTSTKTKTKITTLGYFCILEGIKKCRTANM